MEFVHSSQFQDFSLSEVDSSGNVNNTFITYKKIKILQAILRTLILQAILRTLILCYLYLVIGNVGSGRY